MALFESYERRIDKINGVLAQYGIGSVEECRELCKAKGFDPYEKACSPSASTAPSPKTARSALATATSVPCC